MKKLPFITLFLLVPNIVFGAAAGTDVPNVKFVGPNADVKFRWALSAVGDTLDTYVRYRCADVQLKHLIPMVEFMKQHVTDSFSQQELLEICKREVKGFATKELYLYTKEGDNNVCKTDQKMADAGWACVQFVKDLVPNNNKYSTVARTATNPGTYIRETDMCDGKAYKVETVVPGNSNAIYIIHKDGTVERSEHTTRDNATFLNETAQTNGSDAGSVRGVYSGSYIFFQDVTLDVQQLVADGSGTPFYTVGAGTRLMPGKIGKVPVHKIGIGSYDFKVSWTDKACDPKHHGFFVPGQTRIQAHTNGVIYNGQVVTLENLGHMMAGMHEAEIHAVSEETIETGVRKLQALNDNWDLPVKGFAVSGFTGAAMAIDSMPEAEESKFANTMRKDAKQEAQNSLDDKTFIKCQTANEDIAIRLAQRQFVKTHKGVGTSSISCRTKDHLFPDSTDTVTCYYANGDQSIIVNYKFNDVNNFYGTVGCPKDLM